MIGPNTFGEPKFTIHGVEYDFSERPFFTLAKLGAALAVLFLYVCWFTHVILPIHTANGSYMLNRESIAYIALMVLLPGIVCFCFNFIGERTHTRYNVSKVSVELRLYDDWAVKYSFKDLTVTFVQMPYEKIRRCEYMFDVQLVVFTGKFRQVTFFPNGKGNSKQSHKKCNTVFAPVEFRDLSEITSHSPIAIHYFGTEEKIHERS